MNLKKYKKLYITLFTFLISFNLFAGNFGPENSSVKIGDDRYPKSKIISIPRPTHNRTYSAPASLGYFLIRFFQIFISSQDGANCRYRPTCSAYGRQAVQTHGLIIGSFMAGDRIIRCNPYNKPGYDPVPESITGDNND